MESTVFFSDDDWDRSRGLGTKGQDEKRPSPSSALADTMYYYAMAVLTHCFYVNRRPSKPVETILNRFTLYALPFHLDVINQHRQNIEKVGCTNFYLSKMLQQQHMSWTLPRRGES